MTGLTHQIHPLFDFLISETNFLVHFAQVISQGEHESEGLTSIPFRIATTANLIE